MSVNFNFIVVVINCLLAFIARSFLFKIRNENELRINKTFLLKYGVLVI